MVSGINHITLSTSNLEKSFAFYKDVLGLRPVARWYKGAYLEAGDVWVCLALDPNTRKQSSSEYTHTALSVSSLEFPAMVNRITEAGAVCWQENHSPGDSFYFLDADGHKLEIHAATLAERL